MCLVETSTCGFLTHGALSVGTWLFAACLCRVLTLATKAAVDFGDSTYACEMVEKSMSRFPLKGEIESCRLAMQRRMQKAISCLSKDGEADGSIRSTGMEAPP